MIAWLTARAAGAAGPYIIGALLAVLLALAVATGVQTLRLHTAQNDAREAQLAHQELLVNYRAAQADATRRAAEAGAFVRQRYDQQLEADRPVVERVVHRVRNVCLRDESTAAHRDSAVPAAPGVADEAAGESANNRDRAFALAIAADLETCHRDLQRMSALQSWVRLNSQPRASDDR